MARNTITTKEEVQKEQRSFIGGIPRLPSNVEIPKCNLCGEELTFFFQIELPKEINGGCETLAIFACTSCASEDALIPKMWEGVLQGSIIDENFLKDYQTNFSFIVFPTETAEARNDYKEKVKYKSLVIGEESGGEMFGCCGGNPNWLLDDEAPSKRNFEFILQVNQGYTFEIIEGAPSQIEIGIFGDPEPSPMSHYQLFISNAIYLFSSNADRSLVYAITQV